MQKVWLHDARRDAISGDLDFSFLRPRAPAAVHAFLPACPYIPFLLTNSPTFRLFHVPFAFEGLLLFLSADAPSFLPFRITRISILLRDDLFGRIMLRRWRIFFLLTCYNDRSSVRIELSSCTLKERFEREIRGDHLESFQI